MSKKLTVTDLLKQKEKYQVKNDVKEEVYVERLDANVVIAKAERSLYLEAISMSRDEEQSEKADAFLVYNTVIEPNLKDAELQKAFDCKEPTDIVEKLFEPGETAQLAQISMGLGGYKQGTVAVVKDLKN